MSASGINADNRARADLLSLSQQEWKAVQSKALGTRSFLRPGGLSMLLLILSPSVRQCDQSLCPQDLEDLSTCHGEQKREGGVWKLALP